MVPGRVRHDELGLTVVRVARPGPPRSERFIAPRLAMVSTRFCALHLARLAKRWRRDRLVRVAAIWSRPGRRVAGRANQLIAAADIIDDGGDHRPPGQIAAAFADEQFAMALASADSSSTRAASAGLGGCPRGSACGRTTRLGYAAAALPVRLTASSVEVLDGPQAVARHERVAGKYAEILILDHYLEILRRKPGALPGATALAQASGGSTRSPPPTSDTGTPPAARRDAGDTAGTWARSRCCSRTAPCPPPPLRPR